MPKADNELERKIDAFLTRKFSEHPELSADDADVASSRSFNVHKPQKFGF